MAGCRGIWRARSNKQQAPSNKPGTAAPGSARLAGSALGKTDTGNKLQATSRKVKAKEGRICLQGALPLGGIGISSRCAGLPAAIGGRTPANRLKRLIPRCRSGFRLRAPAAVTPANRLKLCAAKPLGCHRGEPHAAESNRFPVTPVYGLVALDGFIFNLVAGG
jgi:hypothetical protein